MILETFKSVNNASCRGMWEQQSKPSDLGWTGLHPDLGAACLSLDLPGPARILVLDCLYLDQIGRAAAERRKQGEYAAAPCSLQFKTGVHTGKKPGACSFPPRCKTVESMNCVETANCKVIMQSACTDHRAMAENEAKPTKTLIFFIFVQREHGQAVFLM